MATDFNDIFAALVERYAGRPPNDLDGCPEADLLTAEERLGIKLPLVLRTYYRLAGRLATLNQAHDILFTPPDSA